MKFTRQIGNVIETFEGTPQEIVELERLLTEEQARVDSLRTGTINPFAPPVVIPAQSCPQCGGLGPCFHIDLIPYAPPLSDLPTVRVLCESSPCGCRNGCASSLCRNL
jgi:hypothetical protein